ncbi:MAG TPA: hypothetical protein DCY20_09560 [Firmicutes bacterium]|nr:hypothetical protein [Bacillota bacterium]
MYEEFLNHFNVRMKKVGAYAILFRNSMGKTTWKNYGIEAYHEQVNLIFSLLLFIMECSLKEEPCTMDELANYLDQLNMTYFKKSLTYEQCKELAHFMVDTILCNDGKAMYFEGYCYEDKGYDHIHISFVGNKIVYMDNEVKRTSYFLTDEGYELMLSTLEVDSHLQLTIQEMIFKLHLEKATYDKAVDDVKNIFNLLRIQFQKIEGAMHKIRQNALLYSVSEYKEMVEQNLDIIENTKEKFLVYRDNIKHRVEELEEKDISIAKLDGDDVQNLGYLKTIEMYLNKALDEHQRILNSHFDLKRLYTKELEGLAAMSLIQRFNLRTDVYEEVLKQPALLGELDYFLRPLFSQSLQKTYNLNKSIELQRPISKKQKEEEFFETVEEESLEDFIQKQKQAKLKLYKKSLEIILTKANAKGQITLDELNRTLTADEKVSLIPSVEIFKEIMVELLQAKVIDLVAWKKERAENIMEQNFDFQLSTCLLDLIDEIPEFKRLSSIEVFRLEEDEVVNFNEVRDEVGRNKTIRCSNLVIRIA